MSDLDRYLTEEVLGEALRHRWDGGATEPLAGMRDAFRAALPGILAQHRADVTRELHAHLADCIQSSYCGGQYLRAKRLLQRMEIEMRFADEAVPDGR